jgi:hypothetical protein
MCRKLTCLASLVLLLSAVNRALALGPATDPSPANGATIADTWVSLSWQPGIDAVLHDVYFGENFFDVYNGAEGTFQGSQDLAIFVVGFPGFAYPDGLVPGTTYYWRIDEIYDNDPNSPWRGAVWSFSIPPRTAYNPNPADNAVGVPIDAILSWSPGLTAAQHDVYLGTNPDLGFADYMGSLAETMYWHAPGLIPGVTYYWRIDEIEADGTMIYGDVWRFTTTEPPPPLRPVPPINISPRNGATNQSISIVMRWEDGGRATSYRVYFGTDSTPDSSEFKGVQTGTSYYPGILNYRTTYYWRIDARNSSGTTTGDVWRFTTTTEEPPPIDGGVKAEYFAGIIPQGVPCLTRIEPGIDNNWGNGEVACDRSDQVSARWTADLAIPANDTYTFYTTNDNGVRLYLDRRRIIDYWIDSGVRDHNSQPQILEEGFYPLVMEWYHNSGPAVAQLFWETPTMGRQIIPPEQLRPSRLQPQPGEETAPIIEPGGDEYFTGDVDAGRAVFQTWIGGGHPDDPDPDVGNGTGMRVGHIESPYVEQTIVYSGTQSMPLYYDNSKLPFYSQADRTWDSDQNWTVGEDEDINYRNYLSLQVYGRPGNDPDQFYIRIEDARGNAGVVFNTDPDILRRDDWTSWWIPLSDFADAGVDLRRVRMMSIGMRKEEPHGLLNDSCVNARLIGNVTNLAFDTTDATFDGPGHAMFSPNIWYIYTATCTGCATVSLCGSSFDTRVAVYDGSNCYPRSSDMIESNDDFCERMSQMTFPVVSGHKYLIEVGGYSDDDFGEGVLSINCDTDLCQPSNDDCEDAEWIGNVTYLPFCTTCATFDGPGHCIDSSNIWYLYTAPQTCKVTVSLLGSKFDTMLAVYEGGDCYPAETDLIECNDDAGFGNFESAVTFDATAGNDYLIEIGGYSASDIGNGVISIYCEGQGGGVYNGETDQGVLNINRDDDLASPILNNDSKLFDDFDPAFLALIDQLAIFGITTIPAKVSGNVREKGSSKLIFDAKVAFVLQGGWIGEFWDKTDQAQGGKYEVQLINGMYDVTVTKNDSILQESTPLEIKGVAPEIDFLISILP